MREGMASILPILLTVPTSFSPFLLLSLHRLCNESDLQGIKTFARKDGSDYILNGSKMFITNGWLADVFVVVAVTNKEAKSAAHGISLFIVDADTPGFKKGWLMKKIGNAASVSFYIIQLAIAHSNYHTRDQILFVFVITRTRRVYSLKTFAFLPALY